MKHRRKFQGDGHKAAELLYGPRKTEQQRLDFNRQPADSQDKKEKH